MMTRLHITPLPSPNHDARTPGVPVDILVLHYTGMDSAKAALDRLTDPAAKVSAHYTVDEDGRIYGHVAEDRRAWHAGVSHWKGASDINARSIGIEIVNPGHELGYREFTQRQIEAVTALGQNIIQRHAVPAARILAHSDVAPARKQDPGELFPWAVLAHYGVGLWSDATGDGVADLQTGDREEVTRFQKSLVRFGYGLTACGLLDEETASVVKAFQRHFRPALVTGVADGQTLARLAALLEMAGL